MRILRSRAVALLGALALTMTVAACGSSGSSGETSSTPAQDTTSTPAGGTTSAPADGTTPATSEETTSAAPADLIPVKVGVVPIGSTVAVHIAQEEGLFAEQGLEVTLEQGAGAAVLLPQLVRGDIDVSWIDPMTLLNANSQGMAMKVVAPGAQGAKPGSGEPPFWALAVAADSPIATPADLVGKKVAINVLGTFQELAVKAGLRQAGIDPAEVQLVEIPFPDQAAALEAGNVDAITPVEPFLTLSGDTLRVITDYGADLGDELPFGNWAATDSFITENPDVVQRFHNAIIAANTFATENPEKRREYQSAYTGMDPALTAKIGLDQLPATLNVAGLEYWAQLAFDEGLLKTPVEDVSALVWESGQ